MVVPFFPNLVQNKRLVAGAGSVLLTASAVLTVTTVQSQGVPTVKIDGSSTVYPVTEAVAEDFQKANKGNRVTVGVSGTGGGFKKFCSGATDISNASRPISASEREACKKAGISYIELPIAFDALTVVVNKSNPISSISTAELKKMWEPGARGKITKWNQVNSKWPNAPLKLYGPGADSGTFDYFTEAVNGKSKSSRTDYSPSEDDNVLVQGVARDKNALGYFGFAYYEANKDKIKALSINDGKGAVAPSRANVENGKYSPLSRPIFIYVSTKAAQRPEVKKFVDYYLTNAAKAATAVKYVPLPAKAYQQAKAHFQKGRVGSVYVGRDTVGLTINEVLTLDAKE